MRLNPTGIICHRRLSPVSQALHVLVSLFLGLTPQALRFRLLRRLNSSRLNSKEKLEVITNCDHLTRLKFAKSLPFAFTEHGALMAATVLNSPPCCGNERLCRSGFHSDARATGGRRMKAKRGFPKDVVAAIRDGKILGIRAGTKPHRIIGIWAVVVENRVFVRHGV